MQEAVQINVSRMNKVKVGSCKQSSISSFWDSSLKVPRRRAFLRPPVTSLILLELLRNPTATLPAAPHCLLAAGCWTPAEGQRNPGRTFDRQRWTLRTRTLSRSRGSPKVLNPSTQNFLKFQEKETQREKEREKWCWRSWNLLNWTSQFWFETVGDSVGDSGS